MGTKIQWADERWNPIVGCSPISEGCKKCYAARFAKRLHGRYGYPDKNPFQVTFHADRMIEPFRWRKARRIFLGSMTDLFHKDVKEHLLDRVFGVVAACERNECLGQHVFMVLTKRPERMRRYFSATDLRERLARTGANMMEDGDCVHDAILYEKGPLLNLWLGVSAENQKAADARIPILLDTPATIRFVSVEPMLELVDLSSYLRCEGCGYTKADKSLHGDHRLCKHPSNALDWGICGGETGSGARPMAVCAATHLRDSFLEAGVPFFFKGHGTYNRNAQGLQFVSDPNNTGRLLNGREWNEFPEV